MQFLTNSTPPAEPDKNCQIALVGARGHVERTGRQINGGRKVHEAWCVSHAGRKLTAELEQAQGQGGQ